MENHQEQFEKEKIQEKGLTKVDPFSIFRDMKNLTIDQVELVFSLFLAQNADRKISDLFPSEDNYRQTKIKELKIKTSDYSVRLYFDHTVHFRYISEQMCFETWDIRTTNWYSFDIMKYISLEDKV